MNKKIKTTYDGTWKRMRSELSLYNPGHEPIPNPYSEELDPAIIAWRDTEAGDITADSIVWSNWVASGRNVEALCTEKAFQQMRWYASQLYDALDDAARLRLTFAFHQDSVHTFHEVIVYNENGPRPVDIILRLVDEAREFDDDYQTEQESRRGDDEDSQHETA